ATPGGAINTSGSSAAGGSINTSNGGGSIDLTGNGSIQFGTTSNRITIQGLTGAAGKTLTLPNVTGTLLAAATTTTTSGRLVTSTSTAGANQYLAFGSALTLLG